MKIANAFEDTQEERYKRLRNVTFWALVTVVLTTAIVCINSCNTLPTPAQAAEVNWENFSDDQIVEAIGKAENSVKYPYGIKSIDTKGNKEYARQICRNSVHNGRVRWIKAGRPGDLIIFIGLRFCPPQAHKLNSNWVKNVKFYLLKGIK